MAPSPVNRQRARNAGIVALASRDLGKLWPRVDWSSPKAQAAVTTIYRAITARHGRSAAAVAAEFYDDVRADQRLPSRFRATPADPVPDEQINNIVESAFRGKVTVEVLPVDELPADATTSDLPVDQRVQQRLEDSLSRLVLQPGRDTIALNAGKDPAEPRWIRVPTGKRTCAFCMMLASRDLIPTGRAKFSGYRSSLVAFDEETQRMHVFDGNGEKFHKKCDCEAIQVYDGVDLRELSPHIDHYQDIYNRGAQAAGTHRDTKAILREMRRLLQDQPPPPVAEPPPATAKPIDLDTPRHATSASGGGGRKPPPSPPGHNVPVSGDEGPGDRLDRLFRQQTVSATDEQRQSVVAWQRKDDRFYQQIQHAVEGGDLASEDASRVAADLQDLAIPLSEDTQMWRGLRDAGAAFGVERDQLETIIGQPVEQQRFMATSADRDVAINEFTRPGRSPILLKVTAKAGSRAVWIPPLGDQENAYQQELLFAPGVILRILNVDRETYSIPIVEVEVSDG